MQLYEWKYYGKLIILAYYLHIAVYMYLIVPHKEGCIMRPLPALHMI